MPASPDLPRDPADTAPRTNDDAPRALVIACGALARELIDVKRRYGLATLDVTCLPATLHNRPERIPDAVVRRIRSRRAEYERMFVAYADCGTGGGLDRALAEEGVERLPGAHCYEFYAGHSAFAAIAEEEPGTFYLTDFLARNFERLVVVGLGLDRYPELRTQYFANYRRLVYLSQVDDPDLLRAARRAADRLELTFEHRRTGYGEFATSVVAFGETARGDGPDRPDRPDGPDRPDWPVVSARPDPPVVSARPTLHGAA